MRDELERRAAQQGAIAEIGRRALSGTGFSQLLREAVEVVAVVLGVDMVGYLRLLPGAAEVAMEAGYGWPSTQAHDGRIAPVAPGSYVATAMATGRPFVVQDTRRLEHVQPSPVLEELGIRSSVVAPIGDPPLGFLGAHARRSDAFRPEDADFLAAAGGVLAAAFERHRAEEALHRMAFHDALTGLPNRVLLGDRLDAALGQGAGPTALLLMDLDRFKEVNDALGHAVGDLVLEQVAARLVATVGARGLVGRLGGDEFAVVLPDADEGAARAVAEEVLTALASPVRVDGLELEPGASVGIATSRPGGDGGTLLRHADAAMYRAKRSGSGIAAHDASTDDVDRARLHLAVELRRAVAGGQLRLAYQPAWDLATGRLVGVEALVRWQHPTRGLLLPGAFLELADSTGVDEPMSWWVMAAALDDLAAWRSRGVDVGVAVNWSPRLLHRAGLDRRVAQLLAERDVPASALTIEITEDAVAPRGAGGVQQLEVLARLGATISIDDFGSGWSSLSRLQAMPVGELKVDRSFVAALADGRRAAALVRAIVDVGHGLQLRVVAEGAEDLATVDALRRLGVDVVQGFALGRPLAADRALEHLLHGDLTTWPTP